MTLSTRIAAHLPYMRRFARAVTGSQKSGDAYIAACLEALIEDTSLFPEASNDRVAIYKLFCATLGTTTISISQEASPYAWEARAQANLGAISPLPRQAFLLTAVEQFSTEEAAEVLGIDLEEFKKLQAQAATEISHQVATNVMIIEDEPLIAMDIEQMVEELGHSVTGIARTKDEAVELYHRTQPKLVLADIQLADGSSGIDAVNEILTSSDVPVIFITAYPERLLTGERPEPAFLVTKPFDPDMVKALIGQALFFASTQKEAA